MGPKTATQVLDRGTEDGVKNAFRTGKRTILRPLEPEDLEFLQGMVTSGEIQPYIELYWPLNLKAER